MRLTVSRIVVLLLLLAAVIALGAYWIGPGVVPRARLQLLALDSDSRFASEASLVMPEDARPRPVRYPLIMAVSNTGERDAEPTVLTLSVPGWIRLEGPTGPIEPLADDGEEPLRRYSLQLGGEPIEPGALPQVPAGLDRMSLVVELPAMTCSLRWDGVPELTPSPDWDAETLSTVVVFYSLEERRGRQTGVLTLRLEPDRVRPPTTAFTAGDVSISRPGAALPATDSLTLLGRREATCGAPELRVHLESVVWRTGPTGDGRLVILEHGGMPRRYLVDANGDGIVEREVWDGDSDGLFEASRAASWALPAFLTPVTPVTVDTVGIPAPAPPDSTAARTPRDTTTGVAPDTMKVDTAAIDTVSVDTVRIDTTRVDTVRIDTTGVDTVRIDMTRIGIARVGPDRAGHLTTQRAAHPPSTPVAAANSIRSRPSDPRRHRRALP